MRILIIDNERYHQLAKYIHHNYAIVSTNMDKHYLWHSLKYCKLLPLGEKHNDDLERFANATSVHLMWKENKTSLYLETPPQIGKGQCETRDC